MISPYEAIGPADGHHVVVFDDLQPLLPFDTDMGLYLRARAAGWEPLPEHCPPDSAKLADGWQQHARAHLRGAP